MLKPATPLTVLLFISFVLLLLSVISTPVVKGIPIATYKGVNFGVFGYCTTTGCSGIRVGYTTDDLSSSSSDFSLPSSTRHSLSSLLIVHPVAAFMNLVCLALAAAAHLHSPSHSARYLLGLLILLLPTLLVTLLAFLVDILLFVPHLQWAGWIVLASTILIAASGVVTCAMRRTLVSRKARKKRIAENAEMSGENFYNRQAQESKTNTFTTAEPTMPMVNGAPGGDRLPNFATYDANHRPDEELQPLRSQALSTDGATTRDGASERFYPPGSRASSRPPYSGPTDQFGNVPPVPVGAAMTPQGRRSGEERNPGGAYRSGSVPPPATYRDGSVPPQGPYRDGSVPPPGSRTYGGRGRGGHPSRGGYPQRGGYGPRGPPPPQGYPGRGGFSTEMRGNYGGRGRGGYPPPGAAGAVGGAMAAGAMMAGGQGRPPPGYRGNGPDRVTPPEDYQDRMGPFGPIANSTPYIENGSPNRGDTISPSVYTTVTSGEEQAVPYGARAQSPGGQRMPSYGSRLQSPSGTARQPSLPPAMPPLPSQAAELPSTSRESNSRSQIQDQYVPPRAAWNNTSTNDFAQPGSPGRYQGSAIELPTSGSHVGGYPPGPRKNRVNSGGQSDVYYEDVDPRFASDPDTMPPMPQNPPLQNQSRVPPLLTPGPYRPDSVTRLPQTNSYEDLPGARSPAESEASNFTSVSQRGVNPNWRPGNGGEFSSLGPARRQHQAKRDVLLAGNPDFEIPGMSGAPRAGPRTRGGPGMRGGLGGGPPRPIPASAVGAGADGRYPMGPESPGLTGGMREI
ncbi:SUR7/PalI family-domain-containing protein [Exophiala viscosa]|uniref:SUR7/PalI family-domain-containing protein n=1 Tax=Exophiala viscosa TaxID=2486360 RepID=A0AAN6DQ27_9EURO|nr:SUR7/PalI family-domain-containing protein [Exophiala viscosa]KAI1628673.1 SUR7/PalI family-domain-containing protein [Exophiala viscosa]